MNSILMRTDHFKYTDKGPRRNNQDSIAAIDLPNLLFACVADGVGGAPCGDVASTESINSFVEHLTGGNEDLAALTELTNKKLRYAHSLMPECRGMCTTFTGCTVKEHVLHFTHAGDSRLHIIRGNEVSQLSDNHTEVEYMFRTGQLSEEEAATYPRRNVILSGLGIYDEPIIQTGDFALQAGDRILLTTDGVHETVIGAEFAYLSENSANAAEFGNQLIALLATKTLTDNVSFVVVFVL